MVAELGAAHKKLVDEFCVRGNYVATNYAGRTERIKHWLNSGTPAERLAALFYYRPDFLPVLRLDGTSTYLYLGATGQELSVEMENQKAVAAVGSFLTELAFEDNNPGVRKLANEKLDEFIELTGQASVALGEVVGFWNY